MMVSVSTPSLSHGLTLLGLLQVVPAAQDKYQDKMFSKVPNSNKQCTTRNDNILTPKRNASLEL